MDNGWRRLLPETDLDMPWPAANSNKHKAIGRPRPTLSAWCHPSTGLGIWCHLSMVTDIWCCPSTGMVNPTTGTGLTQPQALVAPKEAATSMGATLQWVLGSTWQSCLWQSQVSPTMASTPEGKRQTRSKSIPVRLDGLPTTKQTCQSPCTAKDH